MLIITPCFSDYWKISMVECYSSYDGKYVWVPFRPRKWQWLQQQVKNSFRNYWYAGRYGSSYRQGFHQWLDYMKTLRRLLSICQNLFEINFSQLTVNFGWKKCQNDHFLRFHKCTTSKSTLKGTIDSVDCSQ